MSEYLRASVVWFYLSICAIDLADLLAVRQPDLGPPTRALARTSCTRLAKVYVIMGGVPGAV